MIERMTIRDIAGFCPEKAIWKMMADVSGFLLKERNGYVLTPDAITIDGDAFMLEMGHQALGEFVAPEQINGQKAEEAQMVWTLGAVAYYTVTGHVVFGGHGGTYQREHPSVALPVLPKGLQALTIVLQRCLCHAPDERVSMAELKELSQKGLVACGKQQRKRKETTAKEPIKRVKYAGEKWPEEMIEI